MVNAEKGQPALPQRCLLNSFPPSFIETWLILAFNGFVILRGRTCVESSIAVAGSIARLFSLVGLIHKQFDYYRVATQLNDKQMISYKDKWKVIKENKVTRERLREKKIECKRICWSEYFRRISWKRGLSSILPQYLTPKWLFYTRIRGRKRHSLTSHKVSSTFFVTHFFFLMIFSFICLIL